MLQEANSEQVKPGKYRHYKGSEYEVLFTARHAKTLEELVLYESLNDSPGFPRGSFWARPKETFLEKVVVDGVEKPRFELVG